MSNLRFVCLDFHAEIIAACVMEASGKIRPFGDDSQACRSESWLRRSHLRTCHEAPGRACGGPGYLCGTPKSPEMFSWKGRCRVCH
jgi:hypothetical protein